MTSRLSTLTLAAALALALVQLATLAARPYHPDAGLIAVPASVGRPIFVQIEYVGCIPDPDAEWFEDGSAVGTCNPSIAR